MHHFLVQQNIVIHGRPSDTSKGYHDAINTEHYATGLINYIFTTFPPMNSRLEIMTKTRQSSTESAGVNLNWEVQHAPKEGLQSDL